MYQDRSIAAWRCAYFFISSLEYSYSFLKQSHSQPFLTSSGFQPTNIDHIRPYITQPTNIDHIRPYIGLFTFMATHHLSKSNHTIDLLPVNCITKGFCQGFSFFETVPSMNVLFEYMPLGVWSLYSHIFFLVYQHHAWYFTLKLTFPN